MARTIIPEIWRPWIAEAIINTNNLIGQGLVNMDMNPDFKDKSTMFHIPIMQDLDTTLGDDNQITSGTTLSPTALTDKEEIGVIIHRGDSIYDVNIENLQTGIKGVQALAPQIGTLVSKNIQRRLIDVTIGAFGTALSGNEYDATTTGDSTILSPGVLVDGLADIYGEVADDLTTVIMHSKVHAQLAKDGYITMMNVGSGATSPGQLMSSMAVRMLGDRKVIINDSLCTPSGANYYTYVVGGKPWYVGYQSDLKIGLYEEPLVGGFKNTMYWYYSICPHLLGAKWNVTTTNPTGAQLQTAGNWAQVGQTKNIKIMRIKHYLNEAS